MFDVCPELIGTTINDTPVYDYAQLDQYLSENKIDIGVICTGKAAAPEVLERLVAGGVKGIWNFASTDLTTPAGIPLENVQLSDSLNCLTYYMLRSNPE